MPKKPSTNSKPLSGTDKRPRTDKDYVQLGKQLEKIYDSVHPDRKRFYLMSFLAGILRGVGTIIGATVVIALILWILNLAGHVPFIGQFTDNIRHTIQSNPR
jgi:hypothetical protein